MPDCIRRLRVEVEPPTSSICMFVDMLLKFVFAVILDKLNAESLLGLSIYI
jgi:hypothetical protein